MSTLPTVSKYDLELEIARALTERQARNEAAEIERRAMRQAEDNQADGKLLEEIAPLLPNGLAGTLGIKGATRGGRPTLGWEYPAGVRWELTATGAQFRFVGDAQREPAYSLSAYVGESDCRATLRQYIGPLFGDELAERLLVELGEIGPLLAEHQARVAEYEAEQAARAAAAADGDVEAAENRRRFEILKQLDELVKNDPTPKRSVAEVYGLLQREIYTLSVSPWDAGSTLRRLAAIAVGGLLLVDFDADEPVF